METIKTKSGEIVLVEVDTEIYYATLSNKVNGVYLDLQPKRGGENKIMKLGDNYRDIKLLGTLSDITEEQAVEWVKKESEWGEYWDYVQGGRDSHISALDSLRSLIESYKLNPDKTVIIKKL